MVIEAISSAGAVEDEASGLLNKRVAVVVDRPAGALAQSEGHSVGAVGPGVVAGRLGVEGELSLVQAVSLAVDHLGGAETVDLATVNGNLKLASGDRAGSVPLGGHIEVSSDGASERVHLHLDEEGGSAVSLGAGSHVHADRDGIGVDGVEGVREQVDANIVAGEAADGRFNAVLQLRAEGAAPADDSGVGGNLDQFVHGVVHQLDAHRADVDSLDVGTAGGGEGSQSQEKYHELHLLLFTTPEP